MQRVGLIAVSRAPPAQAVRYVRVLAKPTSHLLVTLSPQFKYLAVISLLQVGSG